MNSHPGDFAASTIPPLSGRKLVLERCAGHDYARVLLQELGAMVLPASAQSAGDCSLHPQLAWAASGAMWLTGRADGPPVCSPVPVADCARGAMLALSALAPTVRLPDAAHLLGERAAVAGYRRQGSIAPGGGCRLLAAEDGTLAVNLPRAEDWQLLPAWLDGEQPDDWDALARTVSQHRLHALLERASMLGLAVAPSRVATGSADGWYRVTHSGPHAIPRHPPRVVDLSSLWAGPLCGHMFTLLGAEVIKLESWQRPDGARGGPPAFFDLINRGKASVAVDLDSGAGREQLRRLLLSADIVIESSRPRALQQLGLWAEELIGRRPGLTWISITGHGRDLGHRIAYGDDAGVAGGLSAALWQSCGEQLFCGDAIADPLTGLHAALAGWASWQAGGGRLLDVALSHVVRHCVRQPRVDSLPVEPVAGAAGDWQVLYAGSTFPVARPSARVADVRARALGGDNTSVLASSGLAC